ncbi:uncharacterized protein I206_101075 [Kwoniella pini CBS 10737]|uniref:Amine oxidase domain-containing protein n=1 Tax=Kwoniella pini CBS 10737 TaxID=1296096 RepID=A0A1B9IBY9_9TREE|nr:uncharacterized protein I206_00252 [Kwoniella pini CBS 10737]OCF52951.1 hypothetical protein I206_00252 [Kwoniella pini CBS 10737]
MVLLVHSNLNILQNLPISKYGQIFVTLNPPIQPDENKIISKWIYHHPELTPRLITTQKNLNKIQGKRGIYFIGAWTGYGFHEDGWTSGLKIVNRIEFDLKKTKNDIKGTSNRNVEINYFEHLLRILVGIIDRIFKNIYNWIIWILFIWTKISKGVLNDKSIDKYKRN